MLFCQEVGLLGQGSPLKESDLMKCFTQTIATGSNHKSSGEKCLNRYEFLEILVAISAMSSTKAGKDSQGITNTLQLLLNQRILPNAQRTYRSQFWRKIVSDERVVELLNKNIEVIQAAFNYFIHDRKNQVTLEECNAMAR